MPYVYSAGAGAAATAAAEKKRKGNQEEEELTPYTPEDLNDGWEFKIVRSSTRTLSKPNVLRQLLDEESRAGWVMVELFDDSRVRLKRPMSTRRNDSLLPDGINPYRTQFGLSDGILVLIGLAIGLILVVAVISFFLLIL